MTLSLWHLLIPYGCFVLLFFAFAAVDVVHMVKFGTYTFANYLALVVFLVGTAFLLWGTVQLLAPVDWAQVIGSVGADVFRSNAVGL